MFAIALGIALIAILAFILITPFRFNFLEDTQWSGLMRLLGNSLFKMGYRKELVYEILEMYC